MRENRLSGSEGGGTHLVLPTPIEERSVAWGFTQTLKAQFGKRVCAVKHQNLSKSP